MAPRTSEATLSTLDGLMRICPRLFHANAHAKRTRSPRRLSIVADRIAAQKLRLALDMYEVGEQMQRMRLRRERPGADVADIEAAVDMWRMTRPGAEAGDSAGRTSTRFT